MIEEKIILKKIFELPQSTDSDFATLMPIFGRLERPNLFIFTSHNIHHNRRFWGLRRTITLQGYKRFAILFSWNTMFVLWSNYSAAFFVAYCTHPFFRNREIFLFCFKFHLSKHKFFPRYSQRHPIVHSISDCVAIFFDFFSLLIQVMTPNRSLFDVFLLRKSSKQINRELIKHSTSLVINQNSYL